MGTVTTDTVIDRSLVLIVDDDSLIRMQLRIFLQREGYCVIEANQGEAGLVAFEQQHPDMVLLDAMMPDVNGFDCCVQLKTLIADRHIPILMITGLDDKQSVDRAFDVGAADYVTKPIHWAVLRQRVRRLLQQARLQQKLESANLELQRLAAIDGLTQVANRRRFDEYLNHEWRRLMHDQLPLSLILCDIDCFKLYNDAYGHQAGDRCLVKVAQSIQNHVRHSTDLVARYGGEEFAIILPNTSPSQSTQIAKKLCTVVRTLSIPHCASLVCPTVTLSLGVATAIPQPELSFEILITQADKALYEAKTTGRDRVIAANELELHQATGSENRKVLP